MGFKYFLSVLSRYFLSFFFPYDRNVFYSIFVKSNVAYLHFLIGVQPYLHESRHLHAMKRVRGVGGRFLNTKKLEEQFNQVSTRTTELQSTGNISESEFQPPENYKDGTSTTCSDVTSASNSEDIFQQTEFGFSGYSSAHIGGTMQDCTDGSVALAPANHPWLY